MDVVEPTVNQASEALVAYPPPQTPAALTLAEPDPFFAGGPYLPADEKDDERHQHDQAIALLRQYQGRGPPPYNDSVVPNRPHSSAVGVRPAARLPTRTNPPSAAASGQPQLIVIPVVSSARKRTRDLASVLAPASVISSKENTPVQGAEESKGEPPTARPLPSTPYRYLSAQEALLKYAILADDARTTGPD